MSMQRATDSAQRFEAVFDAEFGYVWTSLRRLGVPERDLEDLAHDVFVEVHRRFDDYDPARPIRPWLFAFAFRFASDYRRRARNRFEMLHDAPPDRGHTDDAHRALEERQARDLVLRALEGIDDEDQRAVFIMYEIDEVPMRDIASAMNIPLNTGHSRLRLAREAFRRAVRAIEQREEGAR